MSYAIKLTYPSGVVKYEAENPLALAASIDDAGLYSRRSDARHRTAAYDDARLVYGIIATIEPVDDK